MRLFLQNQKDRTKKQPGRPNHAMGEGYPSIGLSFNGSALLEPGDDALTSDAGLLGLRELLDGAGFLDWLEPQLHDPRDADLVVYPMRHLLQTLVLMFAQGYADLSDVEKLQDNPAWSVTTGLQRGAEAAADRLPSLASLSRGLTMLSMPGNQWVLDEAQNGGKHLSQVVVGRGWRGRAAARGAAPIGL